MPIESFISPQNILALLFVLVCLAYWLFTFITFYHLVRFGIGTQPKKIAMLFLVGAGILFSISASAFLSLDSSVLKEKLIQYTNSFYKVTL